MNISDGAELIVKDHILGTTNANSVQQIMLYKHGKVVIVGDDCMLFWNMLFLSNDAHIIFDVRNKKAEYAKYFDSYIRYNIKVVFIEKAKRNLRLCEWSRGYRRKYGKKGPRIDCGVSWLYYGD